MTHSTSSRVSPQEGAFLDTNPSSQQLQCLNDDDGVVRVISNGRMQCPYPAAKAWVSEAVPPAEPGTADDLSEPATASVFYYRQRRDSDDKGKTPALVAWLAALLCLPRLGSGRMRSPTSRENSVDFVSTWQRAQAEAAARRVVPVLKRASELTPPVVPNTPETSLSGMSPVRGSASVRGSLSALPESTDGCSSSYAEGTQLPASCQLPPCRAASEDLVQHVSNELLAQQRPASSSRTLSSRPDSRQAGSSSQMGKRSVRFSC